MKKEQDLLQRWRRQDQIIHMGIVLIVIMMLVGNSVLFSALKAADDSQKKGLESNKSLLECTVADVIDGNTIVVSFGEKQETVRLISVVIPKDKRSGKSYQADAAEFTYDALMGKNIALEFEEKERNGQDQLLAYVYLDGEMFNETILEQGYAKAQGRLLTMRYLDRLREAEHHAQIKRVGIWAESD